jgi:uncharacterized protein (DUF58 family)
VRGIVLLRIVSHHAHAVLEPYIGVLRDMRNGSDESANVVDDAVSDASHTMDTAVQRSGLAAGALADGGDARVEHDAQQVAERVCAALRELGECHPHFVPAGVAERVEAAMFPSAFEYEAAARVWDTAQTCAARLRACVESLAFTAADASTIATPPVDDVVPTHRGAPTLRDGRRLGDAFRDLVARCEAACRAA